MYPPAGGVELWIATAIKILASVGFIMLAAPMLVWLERKFIADFQARIGPNRVGPFGLLQCFVDGVKLVSKESIVPREVDQLLYLAAPVTVLIPALSVAAVVPFAGDLIVNGHLHKMVIADLPVGILFVLALTSLSVYGIVLSGWSSNNKYSLLGGLRSAAQMVSYELPMGLSLITGLMIASSHYPASGANFFTLSLWQIVRAQDGWIWNWTAFDPRFIFLGLLALITFYICGIAETNRAPFDLPEAESELIGGYHTEYGGLRWAMFFLGEYSAMLNVSSVATTVFLGGWHSPYPDSFLGYGSPLYCLHGLAWFGFKIFAIITIYIWLRATLPRIRYDQLMGFSWKVLMPVTLGSVMVAALFLTLFFGEAAPPALAMTPGTPPGGAAPGPNGVIPGLGAPIDQAPPPAPPGHPGPGATAPAGNTPGANAPAAGNGPALGNSPAGNAPATVPNNAPAAVNTPGNGPGANGSGNTPAHANAPAHAPATGGR